MKTSTRLLFFSTLQTSFINVDRKILERHLQVIPLIARGVPAILKILFAILRSDIVLAWFASTYSFFLVFFSKFFGKPSIVIAAGVDVAKDKEINYGIWLNPWKAKLVQYALRHADRVLVVDPFLGSEATRLADYDGKNIVFIPFGFDSNVWKPSGQKEPFILTVAACEDIWRLRKKGIDRLLDAAKVMSETRFVIIGLRSELLHSIQMMDLPNVMILPFIQQEVLIRYYQRAKVYCQVSYTEGLPNALCEAMLCGCIPVGTTRGGIPTAIGDAGILIPYGDVAAMIEAFQAALAMSPQEGLKARARIIENFSMERREDGLLKNIAELLG